MHAALRVLAWLLLAGLVFVTLSPISLRPVSFLPVQLERALALALIGLVFALAYPRRIFLVVFLLVGVTIGAELLQLFSPSRHGRLVDVMVKLLGVAAGLAIGYVVSLRRARG
jgi:VanZ family protein